MSRPVDHTTWTQPLSRAALRWVVPAMYGVCVLLICASLWEQSRRIRLAEDVARLVNEGRPETLREWEALLSGHLGERLNDYPTPGNPARAWRIYELSPRVWLTMGVEYEVKTAKVTNTSIFYGSSELVLLDAPREHLPEAPGYRWLVALLPAMAGSGVWLRVSRATAPKGFLRDAIALLAAAPLLVFVPWALLAGLRVIM